MPQTEEFVATGRRRTSVARIRMTPGSGKIDINGRSFEDYFPTAPLQNVVLQPRPCGPCTRNRSNGFGSAHISHNQVANATVSSVVEELAAQAAAPAREDAPIAAGLLQSVLGPAQAS